MSRPPAGDVSMGQNRQAGGTFCTKNRDYRHGAKLNALKPFVLVLCLPPYGDSAVTAVCRLCVKQSRCSENGSFSDWAASGSLGFGTTSCCISDGAVSKHSSTYADGVQRADIRASQTSCHHVHTETSPRDLKNHFPGERKMFKTTSPAGSDGAHIFVDLVVWACRSPHARRGNCPI